MANVLPEVQPLVSSMPSKGYEMQTGGSARRSFIKNNNDTYYIHGVPGHTHNASAMISVVAKYTKLRDIHSEIDDSWAHDLVDLAETEYTDSVEPHNKEELYSRAIERGIGTITMIPENTNHMIEEPVASISEIRTIVSPKDQLQALTYVNNVHGDGWVDPISGEQASSFNRDDPVYINFYSYEGVPRLETNANGDTTMRQPVYIANPNVNTIRYTITDYGSFDAGGNDKWDGNVEFNWDEDEKRYFSRRFSVYFPAYELDSVVQAGVVIPAGGNPIARNLFKVEFPGYLTSRARDGYCAFSVHDAIVVTMSTETNGYDLIPKIPVYVDYSGLKIFSLAYWYGPPAFRIPVGGKLSIPGPPRQKPNNYPGTYDDKNANTQLSCKPFFRILDDLTDHQYQAREYGTVFRSRVDYMKATDYPPKQVAPGNPAQDATNAVAYAKPILLRNYVRQFGYGESKLSLPDLDQKTSRHGFSSFLKYENSPYSGTNGMYKPSDPYYSELVSKSTSDGVIPYIYRTGNHCGP